MKLIFLIFLTVSLFINCNKGDEDNSIIPKILLLFAFSQKTTEQPVVIVTKDTQPPGHDHSGWISDVSNPTRPLVIPPNAKDNVTPENRIFSSLYLSSQPIRTIEEAEQAKKIKAYYGSSPAIELTDTKPGNRYYLALVSEDDAYNKRISTYELAIPDELLQSFHF